MFERYCRLLHATRNRRLFGQLKQQRSYAAECDRLKETEHRLRMELEEGRKAYKLLRGELNEQKQLLAQSENRFLTTLKTVTEVRHHSFKA